MTEELKATAVLVTTDADRRGVFAGYTTDDLRASGTTGVIQLVSARNCIYWHQSVGGFLGLANTGPNKECRIGAPAESLLLNGITSITLLSEEAQKAWLEAPIYGQ